jgi:hypothetical protein
MVHTHFSSSACFLYKVHAVYQISSPNPTTNYEMGVLSRWRTLRLDG